MMSYYYTKKVHIMGFFDRLFGNAEDNARKFEINLCNDIKKTLNLINLSDFASEVLAQSISSCAKHKNADFNIWFNVKYVSLISTILTNASFLEKKEATLHFMNTYQSIKKILYLYYIKVIREIENQYVDVSRSDYNDFCDTIEAVYISYKKQHNIS